MKEVEYNKKIADITTKIFRLKIQTKKWEDEYLELGGKISANKKLMTELGEERNKITGEYLHETDIPA